MAMYAISHDVGDKEAYCKRRATEITSEMADSLQNDISEEIKTSAIENNNQIFNLKGPIQDFKNSNLILTNTLEYTLKDGNKITLTKTGTLVPHQIENL